MDTRDFKYETLYKTSTIYPMFWHANRMSQSTCFYRDLRLAHAIIYLMKIIYIAMVYYVPFQEITPQALMMHHIIYVLKTIT